MAIPKRKGDSRGPRPGREALFGERLNWARVNNKLTIPQLALRAQVSEASLRSYLYTSTRPHNDAAARLAMACAVSLDWLSGLVD